MKSGSLNLFFETLSNKLRLDIIDYLRSGPKTVGEMCKELKEDQSKVSHSLRRLRNCHFITVENKGKERIYSLNKDTMIPLLKLVDNHMKKYCCTFCGDKKCLR